MPPVLSVLTRAQRERRRIVSQIQRIWPIRPRPALAGPPSLLVNYNPGNRVSKSCSDEFDSGVGLKL